MTKAREYDVVICGGGLAGLGLARQLDLSLPGLRTLVLEKQTSPLPPACHKVGESTVEGGARWLCHTLQLDDYINESHLRKFGLRFFTGGSVEPFEDRLELGASTFSVIPSYQLDRGLLEADLRRMLEESAVELREGCVVTDIEIVPDGAHLIRFRSPSTDSEAASARWVIDALGRRRFLQGKLNLARASSHRASACWWRMAGEIDLDRMVPESRGRWHQRVEERRWLSTNHLMGDGYWVWLIPLSSGATSLGIVAAESQHPVRDRSDYRKSLDWLRRHEPCLHRLIGGAQPLDFHALKHFAHTTRQAFSPQRWCTVGEAAAFTDPLYSHGSDLIAAACTITAQLIARDMRGEDPEPQLVDLYNRVYIETVRCMTGLFEDMYSVFGHQKVMLYKLLWDSAYYWTFVAPLSFKNLLEKPEVLARYLDLAKRFTLLNSRFQGLCRDWAIQGDSGRMAPGRYGFRRCEWVNEARLRLVREQSDDEFLADLAMTLERFEEMVGFVETQVRPQERRPPLSAFAFPPAEMEAQLQGYSVPVVN